MLLIFILAMLTASKPGPETRYTLDETRQALEWVTSNKMSRYRGDLDATAQAFHDTQQTFGIPSLELLAVGYYESRYKLRAKGDRGRSWGIMQVGRLGRRECREYCGRMKTEHEQIMCGACWLKKSRKSCMSSYKAQIQYICGSCTSKKRRTKNKVQKRFNLWYDMHNEVYKNAKRFRYYYFWVRHSSPYMPW